MKVENIKSRKGNIVPNQFIIHTLDGVYFQSYNYVIAFKPVCGKIQFDKVYWDYSKTTCKYRNQFIGMSKAQTIKAIERGEIELRDLNQMYLKGNIPNNPIR